LSFLETVRRARSHLMEQDRVSLRALEREFELDAEALDELVGELVDVQQVAVRDGPVLAWVGPARSEAAILELSTVERAPRDYTPGHLAEQILRSKAALEGERKQVTVLFVDVKSSMELAEQLDAEDWHAILERFFEILTEGVHRFEGTVNQYTGDGIMALFGAPIAHEDHAQRACYAALHLRDALKEYADRLRVERGLNFSARMGLNSGEVVVGKIGDDLRMDYTAKGHTVGVAQRMEALAEAGKALLAGPTLEQVAGYFELRDLGETTVRGVEAPVHVAELQGVGRMRTRFDRSRARGLSRFVGRDEEMSRLEAALDRALAGDGAVVGVVAEAGAGKSRLCHELAERCRVKGISVRSGHGVPHGSAIPLEPPLRFYREIIGIAADDTPSEARQKIAGLIAQLAPHEIDALPLLFDFLRVPDPDRPAPDLSPEARQRETVDLLRRLTAARSEREPAVFIFEDLHWLDPQSEEVVEGIVEAVAGTRTLLVVNFRPEYRAAWMGRTHYQQLALRPLDAQAAGELLASWLGPDPSLEGFAEQVRDRTGGNPFFMEEVVQAAIESGVLIGVRGCFKLEGSAENLEVPASVQSLLAARIDRLDEEAKRLLQTGAVIGDEFSESLLAEVFATPAEGLRQPLRQLVQAEFLSERSLYPEFEYSFKHPLTREVAYGSLLRDRRGELHTRAARVLEAHAGEAADEVAPLLAHHWEQAGEQLMAARWQRRAALRLGMGRVGEALFHQRKIVELLADEPEEGEVDELLGGARAHMIYAAARSNLPEEEVRALFEDAFGSGEESAAHARALTFYGAALVGPGRLPEATDVIERGIAMAHSVGARDVEAGGLAVGIIASAFDAPRRAVEWLGELERLTEGDPSLGSSDISAKPVLLGRCAGLMALRRLGRAEEETALVDRLLAAQGEELAPAEVSVLFEMLAVRDASAGRAETARSRLQRADTAMESISNPAARPTHALASGAVWLRIGSLDEAERAFERAVELAMELGLGVVAGLDALGTLAGIRREQGRLAEARAHLERGIETAIRLGIRSVQAFGRVGLGRVRIAEGGAGDDARRDIQAAERIFADLGICSGLAQVAEARADLAELAGDDDARRRALEEAARLHRTCGDEVMARLVNARLTRADGSRAAPR
jgi:class 3 adenylate cyclase